MATRNSKKKFAIFFVGMVVVLTGFSQNNLFVIHSAVGDTISRSEKIKFVLFPEIKDEDFLNGTITHSPEGYFLHYQAPGDTIISKEISESDINQYQADIEKLSRYYSGFGAKDSTKSVVEIGNEQNRELKQELIDNETRTKIIQQAASDIRLKEDAERYEQIKKGNDITGGAYLELFGKKKKKK